MGTIHSSDKKMNVADILAKVEKDLAWRFIIERALVDPAFAQDLGDYDSALAAAKQDNSDANCWAAIHRGNQLLLGHYLRVANETGGDLPQVMTLLAMAATKKAPVHVQLALAKKAFWVANTITKRSDGFMGTLPNALAEMAEFDWAPGIGASGVNEATDNLLATMAKIRQIVATAFNPESGIFYPINGVHELVADGMAIINRLYEADRVAGELTMAKNLIQAIIQNLARFNEKTEPFPCQELVHRANQIEEYVEWLRVQMNSGTAPCSILARGEIKMTHMRAIWSDYDAQKEGGYPPVPPAHKNGASKNGGGKTAKKELQKILARHMAAGK